MINGESIMSDLTAILTHKNFEYPNNIYFNFDVRVTKLTIVFRH